jgi:hypothetical protein
MTRQASSGGRAYLRRRVRQQRHARRLGLFGQGGELGQFVGCGRLVVLYDLRHDGVGGRRPLRSREEELRVGIVATLVVPQQVLSLP